MSGSAQDWLGFGSVDEDNDPLVTTVLSIPVKKPARVLYHFFDPFGLPSSSSTFLTGGLNFKYAQSGITTCSAMTSPSWLWAVTGTGYSTTYPVPLGTGMNPLAVGVAYNEWPWIVTNLSGSEEGAQFHFVQGLTSAGSADRSSEFGLMFESLGHVIHLLQDAAQPQHVRNDAHLNPPRDLPAVEFLCGSNSSIYEIYVDNNVLGNPQWLTGYAPPAGAQFVSPMAFFISIAGFTNSNFISRGTNCTVPPTPSCSVAMPCNCGSGTSATSGYNVSYLSPYFSGPPISVPQGLGEIIFYQNTIYDPNTTTFAQNDRMTSSSIFDLDLVAIGSAPKFTLNQLNYANQARILVPMAEGYSAGLLNYFFRGSMSDAGNSNGFTITNNTMNGSVPEAMSGQFSLYYDDIYGNRNLVFASDNIISGTWTISIPGNGTASTDMNGNSLSFTPPSDPPPANPGQYILVFQGVLGSDPFRAVAGSIVTIPSVIPPPQ